MKDQKPESLALPPMSNKSLWQERRKLAGAILDEVGNGNAGLPPSVVALAERVWEEPESLEVGI